MVVGVRGVVRMGGKAGRMFEMEGKVGKMVGHVEKAGWLVGEVYWTVRSKGEAGEIV